MSVHSVFSQWHGVVCVSSSVLFCYTNQKWIHWKDRKSRFLMMCSPSKQKKVTEIVTLQLISFPIGIYYPSNFRQERGCQGSNHWDAKINWNLKNEFTDKIITVLLKLVNIMSMKIPLHICFARVKDDMQRPESTKRQSSGCWFSPWGACLVVI